jgi:hypothetical protein
MTLKVLGFDPTSGQRVLVGEGTSAGSIVEGGDTRLATYIDSTGSQQILTCILAPGTAGLALTSGTAYFVYLGRTVIAFVPKYVEFYVSTIGAGAQTAEVGFFSTPTSPSKAGQTVSKLISTGTVDSVTSNGVKRNTNFFSTSISAGTHLWAGIRTAMATTQPTLWSFGMDMTQGFILRTAASGALTGAGPWTGAIVAAATGVTSPDLRGTLI